MEALKSQIPPLMTCILITAIPSPCVFLIRRIPEIPEDLLFSVQVLEITINPSKQSFYMNDNLTTKKPFAICILSTQQRAFIS